MMTTMRRTKVTAIAAIVAIMAAAIPAVAAYGAESDERAMAPAGTSVYTVMPQDDGAVLLGSEEFPVHGDGVGDDTAVIQAAIDEASRRGGENWLGNIVAPARGLGVGDGGGLVFVPEGRYRVSARINLHASVRVIGFGAERPEFYVAPETPAYGSGEPEFVFAATRRPVDFSGEVSFGNNDTFGTGLVNVDLSVGAGNPDAIGVRFSGAQMFLLQDVDIDMGDGYAGIDHNANLMQRVNVRGGRVGLLAFAASPGWQTTIMDSSFTEQSEVAILLHTDAKLSLVRTLVADTARGIVANPGQSQRLHIEDSVFERIGGPAITMNGSESLPAAGEGDLIRAQNQLNIVNTGVIDAGALLRTQPSGRTWAVPGPASLVPDATLGLRVADALGADEERTDDVQVSAQPVGRAALDRLLVSDVPLPPRSGEWVSVVDFAEDRGLQVGRGGDDTAVFQAAIDTHHTVYVPLGRYSITDTLRLGRGDSLIGLHPRQTWLTLPDHAAAFADREAPAAIVETPDGGTNVVSGIGLDTNATNPGAAQVRWRSGTGSLLSDIATQFVKWAPDVTAPGDPGGGDPGYAYRGDTRYNFWIDGGGGTFVNLWAIAGYADNGFFAEHTKVPATLYQLSIEHHRYREVVLHDVTGWRFHALQTEDHIYGWESQAVEIVDSRDIRFANSVFFRVATVLGPYPYAIGIERSTDIVVRGTRGYRDTNVANTRWGATIRDIETGREVPEIDVAYLAVGTSIEPRVSPSGLRVVPADPVLGPAPGSASTTSLHIDNPDLLPVRDLSVTAVADNGIEVGVEAPSRIPGSSAVDVPLTLSVPADAQLGTPFRVEITVSGVAGDRHYAVPLEVSGIVGGANLALSATVSATSIQGTNVAANVINDATTGARWISTAGDPAPALTLELARPAVLNRAVLFTGVSGSTALRVVAAEVSGRIDGTWVPLGSIDGNAASPATISLDSSVTVTAVRVDFAQPSPTDTIARVFEVQLYGTPR
jgi:hypothetical protein